jgi:NADH dehydrogenase [ubiquinone] 1 alpha subcomplex assembly factor 7
MPDAPTELAAILTEHIRAWGPITFAKYMDACLYDPQHGYYTRAEQMPRRDYFTSVDASPIFGRLLARQFREMWVQLGRPAEFMLVEPVWRRKFWISLRSPFPNFIALCNT